MVDKMDVDSDKYVTCISCAYAISWFEHTQLKTDADCPACGSKKQFGPNVYIPEFIGISLKEVIVRKRERK